MGRFPFATVTKRGDIPHTYTAYVYICGYIWYRNILRAQHQVDKRVSGMQLDAVQSGCTLINEADMGTVTFKS